MAARFAECSDQLIENLKEKSKNKNTTVSTKNWLKVWKTWANQAGHSEEIKSYQTEELNVLLEEFYATMRKQDGTEYEPGSLRVMQAALDRHLRDNGCKFSSIRDREFSESKKVLEGKARQLRQQGKGKRPNKARALSENEEETLWEARTLGTSSPQVLSQTVWWLLTQYFGLRGRREHHDMTVCDGFQVWPG